VVCSLHSQRNEATVESKERILMNITTNHHYRPILHWFELTDKEQNEYRDTYDDVEDSSFFRYRNWCYDLNDFIRPAYFSNERQMMNKWEGMKSETFFSAVLVAFSDDNEAVKVGLATS
tara:strand:+ start:1937 stop:2293 length:357 start_codon:yes stop_codon:yes gene_type:complete